jgi:hypothetical protein
MTPEFNGVAGGVIKDSLSEKFPIDRQLKKLSRLVL